MDPILIIFIAVAAFFVGAVIYYAVKQHRMTQRILRGPEEVPAPARTDRPKVVPAPARTDRPTAVPATAAAPARTERPEAVPATARRAEPARRQPRPPARTEPKSKRLAEDNLFTPEAIVQVVQDDTRFVSTGPLESDPPKMSSPPVESGGGQFFGGGATGSWDSTDD